MLDEENNICYEYNQILYNIYKLAFIVVITI